MKKFTEFIVNKRYVFLILFIIATIFSLYLSTKVNINEDIMKYLPKTSETKIGKDIMDKEFEKQDSSTLNVMFKDLTSSEKKDTLEKLKKVDGVSSVSYEKKDEYNKDKYTLYILNVNDYSDSKTASSVYNYINDNFKTAGMSGSIYDSNKPILQFSIIIIAIASAMIILIILSDSYIEPFLYLISIGIAVYINKGTNIIFDNVSAITNSIVAILQLALSMDYSIMLSNRYKQEKLLHKNKIDAMKEALYQSFKSILSSSITTIVGLLALIFMSFTIGRDLGFVLAKGVLLSLISIFFCLPALLLMFDNLIKKTKKKSPKFNLSKLGEFIYKTRYIQSALIVLLFIAAYLLKGRVGILYTDSQQDVVGRVFPASNQVAIVYNNKYEKLISSYCKELEKDKKIDQVLCYSNTINEKLSYRILNKKFKDLGQNTKIDDYLIKLIYYNYYNKNNDNKMTLNEFISFIKSDIFTNDKFSGSLNQNIKDNINLLENFTSVSLINKNRTTTDIADILNMNKEDVDNILILYNSKNINTKMTIQEFVNFILNDVLNDSKYSSSIDSKTVSKLKQLQTLTNKNIINKKMNSTELSSIFQIDKKLIDQLFLFYRTEIESNSKLTLNEFANFALKISNSDEYKNMFDENTIKSLNMLSSLSNEQIITNELNSSSMKVALNNLGLSLDDNKMLLLYIYYTGCNTNSKLTLNDFANVALNMSNQDIYKSYFNEDIIKYLQTITLLNSNYDKVLSNDNLYSMFGIDENTGLKLNYAITQDISGSYSMMPLQFVNTLLQKEEITSQLESSQIVELKTALYIMNNINTKYNIDELVNVLNQDKTIVSVVYGVYDYQNNNLKNISIKDLINFLYNNKSNPFLRDNLSLESNILDLAYIIVNNTNTLYNYSEISNITKTDISKVSKLFAIYDYQNGTTTMTPLELVNLILNNKDNKLLSSKMNNSTINELSLIKTVMNSTINNIKYSSSDLSSLLNIDNNKISLLFSLYNSKYIKSNNEISLKNYIDFIVKNVMNNKNYSASFDDTKKEKLLTINNIMNNSLNEIKYTSVESFLILSVLSDNLDKNLIDLVYMDYGSIKEYNESWKMTIEEFINYLNDDILTDSRFDDFINIDMKNKILDSKKKVDKSKKLIVSSKYSRVVLNTKYGFEDKDTYKFINKIHDDIGNKKDIYVVGNSPMAVEMSKTFNKELNKITLLTMIFIFIIVALTFKDLIIPFILVLIIQTAVYITMSFISITGGSVYFISLLIVQAILMGATIDYAIVYTSYYRESRLTMGVKDSVINAYNRSIHTIISSSSILIIVTLVVSHFASAIAAKICDTISQGTFAASILVLFVLPGVLATVDKFICCKKIYKK